jgi:hypothetical protein
MHALFVVMAFLLFLYVLCGLEVALLIRFVKIGSHREISEMYLELVGRVGELRPFLASMICWPWVIFGVGQHVFVSAGHSVMTTGREH